MPLPEPLSRPCPVCDGRRRHLVHHHPLAAIEGISLHEGYEVVACDRCGMVYADCIPDQSAFDHYYEASSRYEDNVRDGLPSAVDQTRFANIASGLAINLGNQDMRALDFGCSTGGLLAELKARGFRNLAGVDPSSQCCRTVQQIQGIRAYQGTLFTPIPEGQWDLITSVGVLEHVRDLCRAVQNLRDGLCDGGVLYVEVPDLEGFWKTNEAPFQEFSTEHINYFTALSLDTIMARLGMARAFGEIAQRVHSGGSSMQVIAFGYRKMGSSGRFSPERDLNGPIAAKHYADLCAAQAAPELHQIHELASSNEPFAIWGAGTVCCRLLATTELAEAPIAGIIDSNPHLQGRCLAGHRVQPPEWLQHFPGKIFIASRGYSSEIQFAIRQTFGLTNPIIALAGSPKHASI